MISALSLVLEMQQVIAGCLISHIMINTMICIHSTNIYTEHITCHTLVLDTKYIAVSKANKNLHSHRAYNLWETETKQINEICSRIRRKNKAGKGHKKTTCYF